MSNVSSPQFWDAIYQTDCQPWDLGQPTPTFMRLLQSGRFPPGAVLVLGAGSGHDAREFARHGFTVTAVDFSAEAVRAMRTLADPAAPVQIEQADMFALPESWHSTFDYVLDYMCLCAIDPTRRPAYADVVARLLRPGGRLIHLAYPLGSQPGGPPFAINSDAVVFMFRQRGFVLSEREKVTDSVPHRRGREELLILEKGPAR